MTLPPRCVGPFIVLTLSVLYAFLPLPTQSAPSVTRRTTAPAPSGKRLLMAHYMPWFQAKPFRPQWGWHWTMGHFDPDRVTGGRREAASHDTPLIGLYDSDDPDVLECQVLLMKLAGIDGVIFDWYGRDDYLDYGDNNRSTQRMIPILQRAGLRFAICYETQTVPKEIAGGVFLQSDAVVHGRRLLQWMQANVFSAPNYLTLDKRPVLLSFGDSYYTDTQWGSDLHGAPAAAPLFHRVGPAGSDRIRWCLRLAPAGRRDRGGSGGAGGILSPRSGLAVLHRRRIPAL